MVYLGKLMSVYCTGDLITNAAGAVVMVTGWCFAVNGQITLGEFDGIYFIMRPPDLGWCEAWEELFQI